MRTIRAQLVPFSDIDFQPYRSGATAVRLLINGGKNQLMFVGMFRHLIPEDGSCRLGFTRQAELSSLVWSRIDPDMPYPITMPGTMSKPGSLVDEGQSFGLNLPQRIVWPDMAYDVFGLSFKTGTAIFYRRPVDTGIIKEFIVRAC